MFEPLVEVGRWIVSLVPRDWKGGKPRLNFLMVHYLYLISWSIIGSIILFGNSFMPYNDAIFFAVGAATQSGLNTINLNDLYTYQQVALMLIACVTNPIFINTAVVFVRLYWFEKRFKHIVEDLREKRRQRAPTISRTRSEMKQEQEQDLEGGRRGEGVNGRNIRVLHHTTRPNGMSGDTATHVAEHEFNDKMGLKEQDTSDSPTTDASRQSSSGSESIHEAVLSTVERMTTGERDRFADESPVASHREHPSPTLHHRDIRFADEVATKSNEDQDAVERLPEQREIKFADEVTPNGNKDDASMERLSEQREIKFADEVHPSANEDDDPAERLPEQHDDISRHIQFLQRQQRNAKEGTTLRIPGPRAFERGEVPEALSDSDEEPQMTRGDNALLPLESEREGTNTEGETEQNADDHTRRTAIKFEAQQDHPAHRQDSGEHQLHRTQTAGSRLLDRLRRPRSNLALPTIGDARGQLSQTFSTLTTALSKEREYNGPAMPYLSWQATTGRNSAFLGLTEEQREELGGIEYRSLKTLAKILMFYFVGFHLFGAFLINLPFILEQDKWKKRVEHFGQSPVWWAIFTAASEFNDLGMTLTPNSMISFQTATVILLFGSFLIVIGNTGFPVMLRFVIWCVTCFTSYGTRLWEELRFLLDHPRRCFVLLFPSRASWWLFWILVLLNGIDLLFFIVLDLHDSTVTKLPGGFRVLDGWYQAVSTRTAGFAVVDLADLHPAIQVSYLIMMYISVFPIAISVRRTNVYEEKSLGIFGGEEEGGDDENQSYVSQHLRRQLSFDLWYIFLGLFLIAIIEGDRIQDTNDAAFTMFAVLFEIVSAYGTVGLSLGYPGTDTSFSAQFRILSKLIIMAMMLRGRHRGLPYALDRAILLPSDQLAKKEAADADRQLQRRASIFAEGHENERRNTLPGSNWRDLELDENGLPRQHVQASGQDASRTNAGRSSLQAGDDEGIQNLRRRGSGLSTNSANRPQTRRRSKSLSRVIAGGLSAGPTFSKHD